MGGYAWVTLATNDSYSLGALVLARSLEQVGTRQQLAVLITPGVTNAMRTKLTEVFNVVQEVNLLDSQDEENLRLLKRPELGITFTKLHCWRLTQFDKCVFLDADTLVLENCDELFEREELSAAPDIGWPDCFNSGVFVFRPSMETYEKLIRFAIEKGSFDGGDQGLLNLYFSDWAHKDISKHLPFIYNVSSTACYSYLPAFKQFGKTAKIIHFIGATKPWLQYFDTETKKVHASEELKHLQEILQRWWDLFCSIHSSLSPEMAGLAGAFAKLTLGAPRTPEQAALDDHLRRQGWEVGNIDYLGKDSFNNIWSKICETLSSAPLAPEQPIAKTESPKVEAKSKVVPPTEGEVKSDEKAPLETEDILKPASVIAQSQVVKESEAVVQPPTESSEQVEVPKVATETPITESPLVITADPAVVIPATITPDTPSPAAVTPAAVTPAAVTPIPVTAASPVPEPTTPVTAIPAPVIPTPETPAPVTPAPVTSAPVTSAPVTPAPVTPVPVIAPAPVTPAPVAPAPVTPAPVAPAPVTPAPVTPAPVIPAAVATPATVSQTPVTPTPVSAPVIQTAGVPVTPPAETPVSVISAAVTPSPTLAAVTPTPAAETSSPIAQAAITPVPETPSAVTPAPVTPSAVTPVPVTSAAVTPVPVTQASSTPAPVTQAPVAAEPVTAVPVTKSPVSVLPSKDTAAVQPATLAKTPSSKEVSVPTAGAVAPQSKVPEKSSGPSTPTEAVILKDPLKAGKGPRDPTKKPKEGIQAPKTQVTEPTPPTTPASPQITDAKPALGVETVVPETPPVPVPESSSAPTPTPRKSNRSDKKTGTKTKK